MNKTSRPNILLFLTDGMQAETVSPGHPCSTPRFDELSKRGVQFVAAHTSSPTCSPARASLMTGVLPHNHGVLEVEHGRDEDQCVLRTNLPHFAERLAEQGYRTGYFGKWHIERSNDASRFGWQSSVVKGRGDVKDLGKGSSGDGPQLDEALSGYLEGPPGYNRILHYGVTDVPMGERYPGLTVENASEFLEEQTGDDSPWCCCVSFSEPNEALIAGREAFQQYDPESIPLPENFRDDMSDRPGMYRREQEIAADLSDDHWRNARACYYARITELDQCFGNLVDLLEESGQLENTIVIALSDHGRYVGAHGFDAHNFGAFEEIYKIPLICAGPGIAVGKTSAALVGIHDLAPTILELAGCETFPVADSDSFVEVLADPDHAVPSEFTSGYAEYHGTRFPLMQRILWDGPWKMIFNGFDYDELYNLEEDPHEMENLASLPEQRERVQEMMAAIWKNVRETDDRAILESHYFSMRFAAVGPNWGE